MPPAGSLRPSPYSSPRERLRKIEDAEDDKQSTLSHSSGAPRVDQPGKDALRLVAGNRVRHARCAPEFLEDIATQGPSDSLKKATSKKFNIICGSDARTYFKNYVVQYNKRELKALRNVDEPITNKEMPAPIVFAVTVWDGGRKCVDYHMTWRGQHKSNSSPDFEKKVDRFDRDFRRLARVLDKEYKTASSLKTARNPSQVTKKSTNSNSHSHKARSPPGITISTPEGPSDKPDPTLPDPPPSAADSVMSLPLLNMVRGVPFSHRVPLRVTNPDRLSMLSEISIVPGKQPEVLVSSKPVNQMGQQASNNTLSVPALSKSSKHGNSDDTIKTSSASIRSSDTKSSKSSRSSRSSGHSENKSSRNPSSGGAENDEPASRRRRKDSPKDEEPIEFVIILLEKLDIDIHSWHGLDRQVSIRSVPAERHSPWIGPLASQEPLYSYARTPAHTPDASDSDLSESEQEQWKGVPVIPMKPLMEAMGIIQSQAGSYYGSPVIPQSGLHYLQALSNVGSPPQGQSPYLYSSPRVEYSSPRMDPSSPYVPAWIAPLPASNPSSRPPSRAYSSAYASPYMQSHTTGPF